MAERANLGRVCGYLIGLAALAMVLTPSASAAIPSVFTGMSSPPVGCSVQTGSSTLGQRWCSGRPSRVATWDDTPIDVSVALPPAPATGPDGNFPLIGIYHGWGGSKATPGGAVVQGFVRRGYAVFSMTDRGWAQSCGTPAARSGLPAWADCSHGYIHLDDQAYEERDAQYLIGQLLDDGVVDPGRIGATGGSYGGILSVQLAALNDRTRLPDGSLVPWESPNKHIPLHLAGATPGRFASDIAYALVPNGSTLDYVASSPYLGPTGDRRAGIQKKQILNGFYGNSDTPTNRYYAPAGSDPSADLVDWRLWSSPPGPFDNPNFLSMLGELTAMHSAYYVDDSVAPAPMLLSNGLWDDFVPADEAIRYYNKIRTDHPGTPVAMFFGDIGHARSSDRDQAADAALEDAWLDYYVKGVGSPPQQGVVVYGMTCPTTAATEGPYHFPSYAAMERGEVRLQKQRAHVIQATGTQFGPQLSQPLATSCTKVDATDNPATVNYHTVSASDGGYTIAGAATVLAKFRVTGPSDQLAARLLDVGPDGQEQLIERGLFRPRMDSKGAKVQVFQLHPNVWHVAMGHSLKLELLPDDAPYSIANASSPDAAAQHAIEVSHLRLRVAVMDPPGASGGLVREPAEKFLPPGYALAPDFK
jgi:Acetyl xylan esterase (AXE1)/Prolyl oligopeptidase family